MCARGCITEKLNRIREDAKRRRIEEAVQGDPHNVWRDIQEAVGAEEAHMEAPPGRYNIAPTDWIPTLIGGDGGYALRDTRWGIRHPRTGKPVINAKQEELALSPMWRDLYQGPGRCVHVLSGFYEWRGPTAKDPVYVSRRDGLPLLMAALHLEGERWHGSATITMPPQPWFASVHDRMPVLLDLNQAQWWADTEGFTVTPDEFWDEYQEPREADYEIRPINTLVNNVHNDGPELIQERTTLF